MKLFNLNETKDSLYNALVHERFKEAEALIKNGQTIPNILYYQAADHDNPRIINFLLEQTPDKQEYTIQLAVRQGAIQCLKSFVEKGIQLSADLLSINPRKNEAEVTQYLRINVKQLETNSQPSNFL
jgi:hypothetical protein